MQDRKFDCAADGVSTTGWILSSLSAAATGALGIGSYFACKAVSQFCTSSAAAADQLVSGILTTKIDAANISIPYDPNIPSIINATITTQYGTFPAQITLDIPKTLDATITSPSSTIEGILEWVFGSGIPKTMSSIGPAANAKCQEYLPELVTSIGIIVTTYSLLQTVNLVYLSVTVGSQAKRLRALERQLKEADSIPLDEIKVVDAPGYKK